MLIILTINLIIMGRVVRLSIHDLHTYIAFLLAISVAVVCMMVLIQLYSLARNTIDRITKKTLTLFAHIMTGFVIIDAGVISDRLDDILSTHARSGHLELFFVDIGLIWIAWFSSSLLYSLKNGASEHFAEIFSELKELRHESTIDRVSGLLNRNALSKIVKREFQGSIIFIDIDNFKHYNDTYGHADGDRALKLIGECIRTSLRSEELGFRYGGDEFVVVCPKTTVNECMYTAERIRRKIASLGDIEFSASFGVAACRNGETLESSIPFADRALYKAKQDGRNCVRRADMIFAASIKKVAE